MAGRRATGLVLAAAAVVAVAVACLPARRGAAEVRPSDAPLVVRCGTRLDPASRSASRDVRVAVARGVVVEEREAPEALEIDLSAFTCIPGLIDTHTHLLLQGDARAAEHGEHVPRAATAYRVLSAAASARVALGNGFTTLRDLGTVGAGYADVDLKRVIQRGGLDGPRVFASGPALPDGVLKCVGPDACRRAVLEQVQRGVDWVKVYADRSYHRTPDCGWGAIASFTLQEMSAIVDEAHRLGKRVAAHSMTPVGHRVALAAGVDSIEHGCVLDEATIVELSERRVPYCPTLTAVDTVLGPRQQTDTIWSQLWDAARDSFARAAKAGVPIAFGTDAGVFGWEERSQVDEALHMVDLGMPAWEVLRSATTVAAQLLAEPRLGCLEPDCFADLVAVDGDPSQDVTALSRVRFVMKAGRIVLRP